MSQPKGWMDGVRFGNWINQWYKLIREKSDGSWCLLMDNFFRHELDSTLHDKKIAYLPPKSTAIFRYNCDFEN